MERPYLRELQDRRFALRFRNRRLESEYQAFAAANDQRALRIQLLLAALLVCLVSLFDNMFLQPEFAANVTLLRLGIMMPPILLMLLLTGAGTRRNYLQPAGVLVGLAVGLTSLVIDIIAERYGMPRVFASYEIITVFVYFFLGLRVQVAVGTALTLFLAYLATAFVYGNHNVGMAYNALYLLFLNVAGTLGAYQLSKARRILFLEERILSYRANHDALTQLPNRRAFDDLLNEAWKNSRVLGSPVALLMLDIDCFKLFNDFYGHQAGDQAIVDVARILEDSLQRPQDFAGRYGGEEFVVLLFDASKAFALQLAERIRRQVLAKNIEHRQSAVADCVSVSIGLAWLDPAVSGRSKEGFLQMADEALYAAKEAGRNCVVDADRALRCTTTGIFQVMRLDNDRGIAAALAATAERVDCTGT